MYQTVNRIQIKPIFSKGRNLRLNVICDTKSTKHVHKHTKQFTQSKKRWTFWEPEISKRVSSPKKNKTKKTK